MYCAHAVRGVQRQPDLTSTYKHVVTRSLLTAPPQIDFLTRPVSRNQNTSEKRQPVIDMSRGDWRLTDTGVERSAIKQARYSIYLSNIL